MADADTLAKQAYSALREKLYLGQLPAGAQLVNRTLAAELGLSMTPVREAINRLSSDGVVEFIHGAGAFVRRIEPRDLEQIYELRELLEPYAAAQAARLASPVQLDELRKLCDEGDELAEEMQSKKRPRADAAGSLTAAWSDLESRFHGAVLHASNNRWLVGSVEGVRLLHRVSLAHQSLREVLRSSETAAQTARDHRRLFEAIRDRKAPLAERLMREHVTHGKEYVLSRLQENRTARATRGRASKPGKQRGAAK